LIHCFIEHFGQVYAIGKTAQTTSKLSIDTVDESDAPLKLSLHHYHHVNIDQNFEIIDCKKFLGKCMFIEIHSKKYCVDLFFNCAY
jgi:hypothetical protein